MFGESKQLRRENETLRSRIRSLEGLVTELARRAGVGEAELSAMRGSARPGMTAEIDQALAQGAKIQAIKLYREHTGVGLKEAKDTIEDYERSSRGGFLG
ncbi:ribosomal protein L7/L12 [Brachybacterium sp. DNPG3]